MGGNSSKQKTREKAKENDNSNSAVIVSGSHKHFALSVKELQKIDFRTTLGDLRVFPTEVFSEIAKFLSVSNVGNLSRGLLNLINHDYIWKYFYNKQSWHMPEPKGNFCCYKKLFVSRYTNYSELKARKREKVRIAREKLREIQDFKSQEINSATKRFQDNKKNVRRDKTLALLSFIIFSTVLNISPFTYIRHFIEFVCFSFYNLTTRIFSTDTFCSQVLLFPLCILSYGIKVGVGILSTLTYVIALLVAAIICLGIGWLTLEGNWRWSYHFTSMFNEEKLRTEHAAQLKMIHEKYQGQIYELEQIIAVGEYL